MGRKALPQEGANWKTELTLVDTHSREWVDQATDSMCQSWGPLQRRWDHLAAWRTARQMERLEKPGLHHEWIGADLTPDRAERGLPYWLSSHWARWILCPTHSTLQLGTGSRAVRSWEKTWGVWGVASAIVWVHPKHIIEIVTSIPKTTILWTLVPAKGTLSPCLPHAINLH